MKRTTGKANDLLAAIQRKAPKPPPGTPEPVTRAPTPASTHAKAPLQSKKGRPVQFWLHDEDRKLIRELAAWLAGQGERLSDSLIVRACLRTARTGDSLLEAYRAASMLDGRIKRD